MAFHRNEDTSLVSNAMHPQLGVHMAPKGRDCVRGGLGLGTGLYEV